MTRVKEYLNLIFVIVLFLAISAIIQLNLANVQEVIKPSFTGILLYILITIIATVFAPVSTLPLIPLASFMWGWKMAAVYNIIGWMIGAIIAFHIAKKFGRKFVGKIISIDKLKKYENLVPKTRIFTSIIILRMTTPVDFLSYVLGLFSKVDYITFSVATFIGIIPFAIIYSYLGALSLKYQIIGVIIGLLLTYLTLKTNSKKF